MAKTIKMPVLGNSVEEVRIVQWFKREGDTVQAGEPLAEVETDKTNVEFECPESGVVRKILAPVDAYVKVEAPVVIIGTADEPIEDAAAPIAAEPQTAAAPAAIPPPAVTAGPADASLSALSSIPILSPRARRAADELGVDARLLTGRGTGPMGRIQEKDVVTLHAEMQAAAIEAIEPADLVSRAPKASPLARAVASGEGIDLSAVPGTGAGGRIVAGDVRAAQAGDHLSGTGDQGLTAVETRSPIPHPQAGTRRSLTLTGLRKRVADNLLRSVQTKPHVTLNLSADMTEAMRLRAELLPVIEKAVGVRVSPTDIVVKACAVALREFPYVNAHIEGETITLFDGVHIGLAVSLGEGGLMVPVIKDAHRKGLAQLAKDRSDLAARARAGSLKSDDITGGTFAVTNLGNYGIESFNPIIPPPQVAILGVGAITDTVVARNGQPAVRPMMGLSLSFDHRAIDGAPAAAFLARIKEILESPYLLLV